MPNGKAVKHQPRKPQATKQKQMPHVVRTKQVSKSVSSASSELFDHHHEMDVAMNSYMSSWVDAANPARGPGSSTLPTVLATFTSSTGITFSTSVTGQYTGVSGQYPLNGGGVAGIVVQPHMPVWNTNQVSTGVSAGYVLLPGGVTTAAVYGNANVGRPLSFFDGGFPDTKSHLTDGNGQYVPQGGQGVLRRLVGLRATVTVTQAAMTATGQVYAGDSNDLYLSPFNTRYETTNINGPAPDYTPTAEENITIQSQSMSPLFPAGLSRVAAVGAFRNGAIYEASFLPTNDRVMEWSNRTPLYDNETLATLPGQAMELRSNLGEALSNDPGLIFLFYGLVDGSAVTCNVTASYEFQVGPGSAITFLIKSARYLPRFVPDWMELACCTSGGELGSTLGCFLNCERHAIGYMAAAEGHSPGLPPKMLGNGAVPNSDRHSMVHSVLSGVGTVASSIAGLGAFRYGKSVLKSLTGRARTLVASMGRKGIMSVAARAVPLLL